MAALFPRMRSSLDAWLFSALVVLCIAVGARVWLHQHPAYDPWAPLALSDAPGGWAMRAKIAQLRAEPASCRAFLERSEIAFQVLPPTGEGTCRREDRQVLAPDRQLGLVLSPARSEATCAIGAALARWLVHGVQPQAKAILGSRVVALEHYGTNNCRRIGGGGTGSWSEHATGNAIDIAAFKLADGRRISVLKDWREDRDKARFLTGVRDAACLEFATVLSPDYNAAHADHLHLDQAQRAAGLSACR